MNVDQSSFRQALLAPDRLRPDGLTDGRGGPAGCRFDVYRNNVAVSLTEALETAFPVLRKLVGADNFRLLAGTFLRLHPPTSPLMMFYGSEMPAFLSEFEPTRDIRYLPDVARLELAMRESYHAADGLAVAPEKLAAMDADQLLATKFGLAPSLRLVRSDWPIHSIWRFNMSAGPKPAMEAQDVAVVRPEFDPEPVLLPRGGGTFLEALASGATMGQAIDLVPEEFDLGAMLTILIGGNALTEIGDDAT